MASGRGRLPYWLNDANDSSLGSFWDTHNSAGGSFPQLLSQLNSSQTQAQARWTDWQNHWHHTPGPDHPGVLTVTSNSPDGFVTDATVTAHLTDPDGVRWRTVTYQWMVDDGSGNGFQPIAGATSASFKLTSDYLDKQIDVTATYTDRQGHPSSASDPFTVLAPQDP